MQEVLSMAFLVIQSTWARISDTTCRVLPKTNTIGFHYVVFHCGLVIINVTHKLLVYFTAFTAPSHYLNQCWLIISEVLCFYCWFSTIMYTRYIICIISYPLFADADTGIYPHAASQYHARPKAKRGIAMLSVDKFPYPRKQTRGNEFIPCSNNICDILKRFRSFKIPAVTLIWPKSPYKHSVTRSCRSGKGKRTAVGIAIVTSSMMFLCLYISRWWRQTWDTAPYFTVVNQSEARISTEHGIKQYITAWIYSV